MGQIPELSRVADKGRYLLRALTAPWVGNGGRFTSPPLSLYYEVNRVCNARCQMCGIWQQGEPGLPLEEITTLFHPSFFDHLEFVILSGGEPTLRTDLGEIAGYFIRRLPGIRSLAVTTTGLAPPTVGKRISDILERIASEGKPIRLFVQVSLDGLGEVFDAIRGTKNGSERVVRTAKELKALAGRWKNLFPVLHCVIQPSNLDGLGDVERESRELGLPICYNIPLISDTYFRNEGSDVRLWFTQDEKERVKRFLLQETRPGNFESRLYYEDLAGMLDGRPRGRLCMMGFSMLYIQHDGNIPPCHSAGTLSLGSLRDGRLEQVWSGEHARAIRLRIRRDFCSSCVSGCDTDLAGISEVARYLLTLVP